MRLVWCSKWSLEEVFGSSLSSQNRSWRPLDPQSGLMIRLPISRRSFVDYFGGSQKAKSGQQLASEDAHNEQRESVNVLHPSLTKSQFMDSYGNKDRAPIRSINDFYRDSKWWLKNDVVQRWGGENGDLKSWGSIKRRASPKGSVGLETHWWQHAIQQP